jgi:hypothetical protein
LAISVIIPTKAEGYGIILRQAGSIEAEFDLTFSKGVMEFRWLGPDEITC